MPSFLSRRLISDAEKRATFFGSKPAKASVGVALPEDGQPTHSGLRTLQNEKLEEPTVVVLGDAPFLIVVLDVKRIAGPPAAALHPSHAP
jgi:hypothetical protein